MTTQSAIRVESDTRSLLNALSKSFTNPTTVLGELLQNARRAGATRIDIILTDEMFVISDNGVGITDFSVLLSMAKSGWDAKIRQEDCPYGIGFLSVLWAADSVAVQSKGWHMHAMTADLLDLKPAALNPSADLGVTEIRLHNYRFGNMERVASTLRNLAMGFPVPVFLNDHELSRPDAMDVRPDLVETEIGWVDPRVLNGRNIGRLYLQGLPIKSQGLIKRGGYNACDRAVCHLRSPMFEGRLPDRDTLLDPERSDTRIAECIQSAISDRLDHLFTTLAPEEFIAYTDLAIMANRVDLLDRIDLIRAGFVDRFDIYETLYSDRCRYDRSAASRPTYYTKQELLKAGVFSVETYSQTGSYESLLASHFVTARKGFVFERRFNADHWITQMVREITPDDFTFEPVGVHGSDTMDINGNTITVTVATAIQVTDRSSGECVAIPIHFDPGDDTLYITPEACAHDAAHNVDTFLDECESYDEAEADRSADRIVATRNVILNKDGAALLAAFLKEGLPWQTPNALRDQSFTVEFATNGTLSVIQNVPN